MDCQISEERKNCLVNDCRISEGKIKFPDKWIVKLVRKKTMCLKKWIVNLVRK
jgi:hypothetical protein